MKCSICNATLRESVFYIGEGEALCYDCYVTPHDCCGEDVPVFGLRLKSEGRKTPFVRNKSRFAHTTHQPVTKGICRHGILDERCEECNPYECLARFYDESFGQDFLTFQDGRYWTGNSR